MIGMEVQYKFRSSCKKCGQDFEDSIWYNARSTSISAEEHFEKCGWKIKISDDGYGAWVETICPRCLDEAKKQSTNTLHDMAKKLKACADKITSEEYTAGNIPPMYFASEPDYIYEWVKDILTKPDGAGELWNKREHKGDSDA
jgi:hypothetical protein